MTTTAIITAIHRLIADLVSRVKDTKTAEIVQKIQRHQHELEKTIHNERSAHEKEIAKMRLEYAQSMQEARTRYQAQIYQLQDDKTKMQIEVRSLRNELKTANKKLVANQPKLSARPIDRTYT